MPTLRFFVATVLARYLEAHWGDVHTRLMVYASNQINAQLPLDLQARVEEGVTVSEEDETARTVYPDVHIAEQSAMDAGPGAEMDVAVAEPIVVTIEKDLPTSRRLEIVDTSDGGRVVTVIEILSPANKAGSMRQWMYLRKQRQFLDAGVNLVEIDLFRSGNYVLSLAEGLLPPDCRTPYLICVRRVTRPDQAELYPVPLRESLPNIRVPLRPADKDVVLRLQPLLDDCYRDGRYARLNYRVEPVPRLGESDARWADAILREKGLR